MKLWRVFRVFAVVARPVMSLLGVKKGTVADKAADIAPIIADAVEKEEKKG